MFRNVEGPFVNAEGKMETLLDMEGVKDVHIASKLKARPAPVSTVTRVLDVYTFAGVQPEVVIGFLLWRVAKSCRGELTALPRVRLSNDTRMRILLSCLHAAFPTEYDDNMRSFGGVSVRLVPFTGVPLADMAAYDGTGPIVWTAANTGPYGITGGDVCDTPLSLCKIVLGVYLWGMIRQIVPNKEASHISRRRDAIKGIIGGDYPPTSLVGQAHYPTATEWLDLTRMGDSLYHVRGVIMRPACMIAYATQSESTAGFSAHISLLEGYGLGNFRAVMRMQVDAGSVIVKNSVLAAGSREFFVNCYKDWKNLSEFDQMYKKVIEGSEYKPMAKMSNRLIGPAAMLYMKVSTEGMDSLVVRGLRESMSGWLVQEFAKLSIAV
jgi:hypothetical protein